MGVPLLYPWANRLAGHDYMLDGRDVRLPSGPPLVHCEEHGLPIHGLLHASPHWRTTSRDETRIRAALDFGAHPELLAAFPFPHTLEIEASLSIDRLRITTTVRPTSTTAVPIAFGFHPYLRLPGVPRAGWQVTLPPRRHLVLDERGIPTGAGERQPATRFELDDRGFDDGYDGLASRSTFSVSGGRPDDHRRARVRVPGRAGVLATRQGLHLLRADDRADERAAERRRACAGSRRVTRSPPPSRSRSASGPPCARRDARGRRPPATPPASRPP